MKTNFIEYINEKIKNKGDELKNKLLQIGGNEVKLGLDTEEELKRMLYDGKLYEYNIRYINGSPNQCHRNVADKYKKLSNIGFKIISGYALNNNIWIQHSWGYKENIILETTNIKFYMYYGYELNESESDEFCFSNY